MLADEGIGVDISSKANFLPKEILRSIHPAPIFVTSCTRAVASVNDYLVLKFRKEGWLNGVFSGEFMASRGNIPLFIW